MHTTALLIASKWASRYATAMVANNLASVLQVKFKVRSRATNTRPLPYPSATEISYHRDVATLNSIALIPALPTRPNPQASTNPDSDPLPNCHCNPFSPPSPMYCMANILAAYATD